MQPISYARHQFSPDIIRHAVWLYYRFTLSYRDVEELLAERGIDVSYESVRRWALKFGPKIAAGLIRRRPRPDDRWNLDEMVVRIAGRHMFLWRAVDSEGEVLDMLVQRRRDKFAVLGTRTSRLTFSATASGLDEQRTRGQPRLSAASCQRSALRP